MTRLLNANFARMFKGKLFWICAVASVLLGLLEIIPNKKDDEFLLIPENYLFDLSGYFFLIITALFVGIFVGAEHGGVLRNKIIVGQKRLTIYLSNVISCSAGIAVMHILFFAAILVSGILCGRKIVISADVFAIYELLQLVSLLSTCSLFTAITMLIPKKFAGTIAALVLIFVFFFINNSISYRLRELVDYREDYNLTLTESERAERDFLYIVQDTLPLGQFEQIQNTFKLEIINKQSEKPNSENEQTSVPFEVALYSLGIIAVTTAVGVISFSNTASALDGIDVGRLFERFYTVESAHNSTGLGLSIARSLVERMGGIISADYSMNILCIRITFKKE